MIKPIKIAVSGDQGSFSEEAGLLYASNQKIDPELLYAIDMQGVLAAIQDGNADIGIFPVVNKRGGLVRMAFDAMGKYRFKVIDELWLDVKQCLLARKDMMHDDIKKIVSHSQALLQCKTWIQTRLKNAELIESQDTAKSARELSEGKLETGSAVIAPRRAAEIYGLKILDSSIQDDNPNLTAFIIVSFC